MRLRELVTGFFLVGMLIVVSVLAVGEAIASGVHVLVKAIGG